MNGKGSWPRPRFVTRDNYGDNYDRIFAQGQGDAEPEPTEPEERCGVPCATVRQLQKMLGDLPERLRDTPVFVHIAAEGGWATAPLRPQVGRHSCDEVVLLSVALPDMLEEYDDSGTGGSLYIVK